MFEPFLKNTDPDKTLSLSIQIALSLPGELNQQGLLPASNRRLNFPRVELAGLQRFNQELNLYH